MKNGTSLLIKILKNVVIIVWFIIIIVIKRVKKQFLIGASKTPTMSNVTKSFILDATRILDTNLIFDASMHPL